MEPLIKNENFNITFYKKMLEKIKQCKDALCPDSEEANQVGICSGHSSVTVEGYEALALGIMLNVCPSLTSVS